MLLNIKNNIFSEQRIFVAIIIVVCFFSYIQITSYEFLQWDDDAQITKNVYTKILNWQTINHNFVGEKFTFLSLTIFSVIYHFWGNNPAPFHWLSIILHLLNVVLTFQLIRQFSKNIFTVSFVLLLFALHPMRVESVAWVSETKDLLFAFFSLLAFLFYLKYLKNNLKFYFFILASLMAILASFSKIQGLLVPFSFFLIDIHCKRKFSLELILEKVFLIIMMLNIFIFLNMDITGILIALLIIYFLLKNKSLIQSYFITVFYKKKFSAEVILKIVFLIISFVLIYFIFYFLQLTILGILIPLMIIYFLLEKTVFNKRLFNFRKFARIKFIGLIGLAGSIFFIYFFSSYKLAFWQNVSESRNIYSFFERFLLAGYSLWFYIKNFFFPFPLNAVHPYPVRLTSSEFPAEYYLTLIALLLVVVFSIFLILKRKKIPDLIFFGWFF
jgi:hypothetical protein